MNKPVQRLLVVLSLVSVILAGSVAPVSAAPWRSKVDPRVLQAATQGETEFLVYLSSQADLSGAGSLLTKLQKGWYVYHALTSVADRAQKPVIAELESLGVEHHAYWIADMIWVRGTLNIVQLLAGRPDVAHLYANPRVALDAPFTEVASSSQPQGVEWNIAKVNAPEVWALGYTGQGVVIGGADTGYAWDQPAIKNQYRGWDGSTVNHDYNWFDATADPSPTPIDPYPSAHGTHTMGIMVGDDGGDNQIGMAPGARWIGCRNMDADGKGSPQTYIACYQWFVAPTRVDGTEPRPDLAPDVINNSWSCPLSEGCIEPDVLLTVVQNLRAAGIVSTHSAGNSGSGCGSVDTPAAIYDESFTVGATDSTDTIASFSNRGPITVDGSERPKPDISAPGVGVRSCVPGGYASMTGTSMASPHVAGLVALLISAYPNLRGQVDQIESTIERTALHISSTECGSSGVPNNVYGWGRIDALAAVESFDHLDLTKIASASTIMPGDILTYTLTITNSNSVSPTTNVVLTDTIPVGSAFFSATSPYSQTADIIRWDFPSLDAMGSVSVELVVRVNIIVAGIIVNNDYAVRSDQVALVRGFPVSTLLGQIYFFPMMLNNP
jgi:serine protease AprX